MVGFTTAFLYGESVIDGDACSAWEVFSQGQLLTASLSHVATSVVMAGSTGFYGTDFGTFRDNTTSVACMNNETFAAEFVSQLISPRANRYTDVCDDNVWIIERCSATTDRSEFSAICTYPVATGSRLESCPKMCGAAIGHSVETFSPCGPAGGVSMTGAATFRVAHREKTSVPVVKTMTVTRQLADRRRLAVSPIDDPVYDVKVKVRDSFFDDISDRYVAIDDGGAVYCAPYEIDSEPPSSIAEIKIHNMVGAIVNFEAVMAIRLFASTSYRLYCTVQNVDGIDGGIEEVVAAAISHGSVTTECCKKAFIQVREHVLVEGVSRPGALRVVLDAPPSREISVLISVNDDDYFLEHSILRPTPIEVSSHYKAHTPIDLDITATTKGLSQFQDFTLTVRIEGSSRLEFSAPIIQGGGSSDGTKLTILGKKYDDTPPSSFTAEFSPNGGHILLTFNKPTNRGLFGTEFFDCSLMLAFEDLSQRDDIDFEEEPLCHWLSDSVLSVQVEDTILIGDVILYNPDIHRELKALCPPDKNCKNWSTPPRNVKAFITPHVNSITPALSASLPRYVTSCKDVILNFAGSKGNAGRPWVSTTFTVETPLSETENANFLTFLDDRKDSEIIMIPIRFLTSAGDGLYAVTVRRCNFLNKCSQVMVPMMVVPQDMEAIPSVSIDGAPIRAFYRHSELRLTSSAFVPDCSSRRILVDGLIFSWSVLEDGQPNVALQSESQDPSVFQLSPYKLSIGKTYSIVVTVQRAGSAVSSTDQVELVVESGPLVASIQGSSNIVIGSNESYTLDATASRDMNLPPVPVFASKTNFFLQWSCHQVEPELLGDCPGLGIVSYTMDEPILQVEYAAPHTTNVISFTMKDDFLRETSTSVTVATTNSSTKAFVQIEKSQFYKVPPSVEIDPVVIDANFLVGNTSLPYVTTVWSVFPQLPSDTFVPGQPTVIERRRHNRSYQILEAKSVAYGSGHKLTGRPEGYVLPASLVIPMTEALVPGRDYTFMLSIVDPDGTELGFASSVLHTNDIPRFGSVGCVPNEGISMKTKFTGYVSNWQDEDLPLTYMVTIQDSLGMSNVLQQRSERTRRDFILSAHRDGDDENADDDVTVKVQVRLAFHIYDSLDAKTDAYKSVFIARQDDASEQENIEKSVTTALVALVGSVPGQDQSKVPSPTEYLESRSVMTAALLGMNVKMCSAATQSFCASLNRQPCSSSMPMTCGRCLQSHPFGQRGRANTPCSADRSEWSHLNKTCPGNCDFFRHGTCRVYDLKGAIQRKGVRCNIHDDFCEAACECVTGWSGSACSERAPIMVSKQASRSLIALAFETLAALYDDSSIQNVRDAISLIRSISSAVDDMSPDLRSTIVTNVRDTARRFAEAPDMKTQDVRTLMEDMLVSLDSSLDIQDKRRGTRGSSVTHRDLSDVLFMIGQAQIRTLQLLKDRHIASESVALFDGSAIRTRGGVFSQENVVRTRKNHTADDDTASPFAILVSGSGTHYNRTAILRVEGDSLDPLEGLFFHEGAKFSQASVSVGALNAALESRRDRGHVIYHTMSSDFVQVVLSAKSTSKYCDGLVPDESFFDLDDEGNDETIPSLAGYAVFELPLLTNEWYGIDNTSYREFQFRCVKGIFQNFTADCHGTPLVHTCDGLFNGIATLSCMQRRRPICKSDALGFADPTETRCMVVASTNVSTTCACSLCPPTIEDRRLQGPNRRLSVGGVVEYDDFIVIEAVAVTQYVADKFTLDMLDIPLFVYTDIGATYHILGVFCGFWFITLACVFANERRLALEASKAVKIAIVKAQKEARQRQLETENPEDEEERILQELAKKRKERVFRDDAVALLKAANRRLQDMMNKKLQMGETIPMNERYAAEKRHRRLARKVLAINFEFYIDSIFSGVFSTKDSPDRVSYELSSGHLLARMFCDETMAMRLISTFEFLTLITTNVFLCGLFIGLELPYDTKWCDKQLDSSSCLARHSLVDKEQSMCDWDGFLCNFTEPSLSFRSTVVMIAALTFLHFPLRAFCRYLFDHIIRAPSKRDVLKEKYEESSRQQERQGQFANLLKQSSEYAGFVSKQTIYIAKKQAMSLREKIRDLVTRKANGLTLSERSEQRISRNDHMINIPPLVRLGRTSMLNNWKTIRDLAEAEIGAKTHPLFSPAGITLMAASKSENRAHYLQGFANVSKVYGFQDEERLHSVIEGQTKKIEWLFSGNWGVSDSSHNRYEELASLLRAKINELYQAGDDGFDGMDIESFCKHWGIRLRIDELRSNGNYRHNETGSDVEGDDGINNTSADPARVLSPSEIISASNIEDEDEQERIRECKERRNVVLLPTFLFPGVISKKIHDSMEDATGIIKDIDDLCEDAKGISILRAFVGDVLGGSPNKSNIFTTKTDADFSHVHTVTDATKVLTSLFLLVFNAAMVGYLYVTAMDNGPHWRHAWLLSSMFTTFLMIILEMTIECLLLRFAIPNTIGNDVRLIQHDLRECAHRVCGLSADTRSNDFSASRYLFVSHYLALQYPHLPESQLVLAYRTFVPKALGIGDLMEVYDVPTKQQAARRKLKDQMAKETAKVSPLKQTRHGGYGIGNMSVTTPTKVMSSAHARSSPHSERRNSKFGIKKGMFRSATTPQSQASDVLTGRYTGDPLKLPGQGHPTIQSFIRSVFSGVGTLVSFLILLGGLSLHLQRMAVTLPIPLIAGFIGTAYFFIKNNDFILFIVSVALMSLMFIFLVWSFRSIIAAQRVEDDENTMLKLRMLNNEYNRGVSLERSAQFEAESSDEEFYHEHEQDHNDHDHNLISERNLDMVKVLDKVKSAKYMNDVNHKRRISHLQLLRADSQMNLSRRLAERMSMRGKNSTAGVAATESGIHTEKSNTALNSGDDRVSEIRLATSTKPSPGGPAGSLFAPSPKRSERASAIEEQQRKSLALQQEMLDQNFSLVQRETAFGAVLKGENSKRAAESRERLKSRLQQRAAEKKTDAQASSGSEGGDSGGENDLQPYEIMTFEETVRSMKAHAPDSGKMDESGNFQSPTSEWSPSAKDVSPSLKKLMNASERVAAARRAVLAIERDGSDISPNQKTSMSELVDSPNVQRNPSSASLYSDGSQSRLPGIHRVVSRVQVNTAEDTGTSDDSANESDGGIKNSAAINFNAVSPMFRPIRLDETPSKLNRKNKKNKKKKK